jgi:hypothetical protein
MASFREDIHKFAKYHSLFLLNHLIKLYGTDKNNENINHWISEITSCIIKINNKNANPKGAGLNENTFWDLFYNKLLNIPS